MCEHDPDSPASERAVIVKEVTTASLIDAGGRMFPHRTPLTMWVKMLLAKWMSWTH